MPILSPKEKEALVVDLLDKNCNLRENAAKVHASFTDICRIRKNVAGKVIFDKQNEPAKPYQLPSKHFNYLRKEITW